MTIQNISTNLADMSGLDLDTCLQIILLFKEQCLLLMADLHAQINLQSSTEVSLLLHKLKGSSGNVCAIKIAEMAALAELANYEKDHDGLAKWIDAIEKEINNL